MSIAHLHPQTLWSHFADLNAIPRASKKEERVIQFMIDFANKYGLVVETDAVQNVLIRKPATSGMESRKTIVMQSHLDMVHQKNSDTDFDFDSQGIDMYIDGDWVRARGTTLGADNGIGVATIMAILSSIDIAHPAIEALFTIDEETGMTGALGLKGGWLTGEILLNLDTEEDTEIDIGCAGGLDVTATKAYEAISVDPSIHSAYTITIRGLHGGHSGMDIHKGLGNANKLMTRLLLSTDVHFHSFLGGSLRNAIPREATSVIITANEDQETIGAIEKTKKNILKEFASLEPNLVIDIQSCPCPDTIVDPSIAQQLLWSIKTAHNGVYRMSPDIADLVEASNNIAKVDISNGEAKILCLTRSSVDSSKQDVAQSLKAAFSLANMEVTFSGEYPGWTPNPLSPILKTMVDLYKQKFGHTPDVVACHAGLECGILGRNYPNMDMISYGPTIKGAHSPDERVSISSVAKFWDYTLSILAEIPLRIG
jgi:dipeptidase D